ncbi:hypothetical protein B0H13DRAFT_1850760 [Mycena leptocephala]|nr:hypothetical protein B0H13DRAFT_1850760 [Mycena leptocephala]
MSIDMVSMRYAEHQKLSFDLSWPVRVTPKAGEWESSQYLWWTVICVTLKAREWASSQHTLVDVRVTPKAGKGWFSIDSDAASRRPAKSGEKKSISKVRKDPDERRYLGGISKGWIGPMRRTRKWMADDNRATNNGDSSAGPLEKCEKSTTSR